MIHEYANIGQASKAAVEHIIALARATVLKQGFCTIALAGGSTPRPTYELLAAPVNAAQISWEQIHFFWGDERWVALEHPDSNFAMVEKALFAKVPVPARNIHRIVTGQSDPRTAAERYEEQLRNFFYSHSPEDAKGVGPDPTPAFDLVLLGMGADGHTASLFPGSDLLAEEKQLVAAVPAGFGSPPIPRITFTLPLLNQAKNVLFLIAGKKKRAILETLLTDPEKAAKLYPAARIKPAGNLVWITAEE